MLKILISLVIVIALLSQVDLVKEFFRDASASYDVFEKLATLYNEVEPKEQWNQQKCEEMYKIVDSYCDKFCTDGTGENCVADCKSDFEDEFHDCVEFK